MAAALNALAQTSRPGVRRPTIQRRAVYELLGPFFDVVLVSEPGEQEGRQSSPKLKIEKSDTCFFKALCPF